MKALAIKYDNNQSSENRGRKPAKLYRMNNLPYYDQSTVNYYGRPKHRKTVKRLRERFEKSREYKP